MLNKIISKDIITKENTPLIFKMFQTFQVHNDKTKKYSQLTFEDIFNSNYEKAVNTIDDLDAALKSINTNFSFCQFMAKEYDSEISIYKDRISIYKPVDNLIQKRNVRINWFALGEQEITDAELFFKVGLEAVYIANALQDQWNKQHTTEK
jgi:hypothetical protein